MLYMRCYICIHIIMTNPLWWDFRFRNSAEDKKWDKTTLAEKILSAFETEASDSLLSTNSAAIWWISFRCADPPWSSSWMWSLNEMGGVMKVNFLKSTPLQRFVPNDSDNFLCDLNTTIRITHTGGSDF